MTIKMISELNDHRLNGLWLIVTFSQLMLANNISTNNTVVNTFSEMLSPLLYVYQLIAVMPNPNINGQ
jgi:hypothetical protein